MVKCIVEEKMKMSNIDVSLQLYNRQQIQSKSILVPKEKGLYFWWFKNLPSLIPLEDCFDYEGYYLLYAGISPDHLNKPNSKANLNSRIRTHLFGNAEGSTLRRTLGILLQVESNYPLRRVGSGKRMTFTHLGEQWLDNWLDENAKVSWIVCDEPWLLEKEILRHKPLPLNLRDNDHPFKSILSELRKVAIQNARELDIAVEHNLHRTKG